MDMQPPSQYLPSIRSIHNLDPADLFNCVLYLRKIYNPEVRGSRISRKDQQSSINNCYKATDNFDALSALRGDAFERSYAIQWVTCLISRLDSQSSPAADQVLDAASALLAVCSGTAGAGAIVRTFSLDIIHPFLLAPQTTVSVQVRDVPLDNHDYESVGAQTWGGACVLSELVMSDPASFGFSPGSKVRILELGAGTGLVSLAARQLCAALRIESTIVATDFYPAVLDNLESNIQCNGFGSHDGLSIQSAFLDWSCPEESSPSVWQGRPFDVVFGADIIYEDDHALWIRDCLGKLLLKQRWEKAGESEMPPAFHLIIPLRATHNMESSTIERVFPLANQPGKYDLGKVMQLCIVAKENLSCDTDAGDMVDYIHYTIAWQ